MEHRLIQGGEQFLPFARSCITKLKKLGLPYANQSFEIDGVSVKVRIEPGHEYIRIDGGVGYEFLASDAGYTELPNGDIGVAGAQSSLYPGSPFCTGSGVRYKKTPVFAQSLTDTVVPPRWPVVAIDYTLTTGNLSGGIAPGTFYTFASRPNNSFQTRHWWHNNKLGRLVTSVCATGNGRTWVDWRGRLYSASLDLTYKVDAESRYGPAKTRYKVLHNTVTGTDTISYADTISSALGRGGSAVRGYAYLSSEPQFIYLKSSPITNYSWSYTTTDGSTSTANVYHAVYDYSAAKRTIPAFYYEGEEMFDVAPAAYTGGAIFVAGTQRTPQANWRHAAVCVGRDADGNTYQFFVSTDTHGVFTFYPAKNYFAEGYAVRDIPVALTKVVRVDYPAWVTVQPDDVSTTHDHWLWKFNKDASRACTTPLHHEDYYIYLWVSDNPDGPYGREVTVILPIALENRAPRTVGGTYTPHRLKVFRVKYGSPYVPDSPELATLAWGYASGPMVYGVEYQGKIIPIGLVGNEYRVGDFNTFVGMDPLQMEPEKLTMPGFVEVDITVNVVVTDGAVDFFPSVTVSNSEQYSDNGTLFMDCDYYVAAPKGSQALATPGDLLTAEIEVFCGPTPPVPWVLSAVSFTPTGTLEDAALGGLALTDLYVFHTVRRRSDNTVVARLALMRAGEFAYGCIHERDYIGVLQGGTDSADVFLNKACFYGMVEQADLRFLSFLTSSYSRRGGLLPLPQITALEAGANLGFYLPGDMVEDPKARAMIFPHLLRPRFELRVGDAPVKTIDYSRPEVTGFGVDPETGVIPDPMADTTLPEGVVDRSNEPAFKAASLAVKHYFAHHHIRITNNDTFSFSPDGSWSVYADRRSANLTPRAEAPDLVTAAMPMSPESTELSGVFDIVTPKSGKPTSHKAMFNAAFAQSRDYSFYDQHTWDMGGFGRCGIWTK